MTEKKDLLKPSQPFLVIGTDEFRQEVYSRQGISHFYQFKMTDSTDLMMVPDGCIDLLFEYGEQELTAFACGTVLRCSKQHWDGPREIFAVRFLPGFLPAGLNTIMKDLIEKRVLLYDLIDDTSLIDRMSRETDFYQRIRTFLEEYTRFEKRQVKPFGKMELCFAIKDLVYQSNGLIKIQEISDRTGYTERYIHKVFIELMGFSPKAFCKIIQFQKAIDVLNYGPEKKMTEIAVDLGYYDQAKFIRDFKYYAGITPSRYLKLMKEQRFRSRIKSDRMEKNIQNDAG